MGPGAAPTFFVSGGGEFDFPKVGDVKLPITTSQIVGEVGVGGKQAGMPGGGVGEDVGDGD